MITAIYSILANDAGLNGIVNGNIYPIRLAQEIDLPAITYQVSGEDSNHCKKGATVTEKTRIMFSVFTEGYAALEAITDILKDTLDRYSGTVEGIKIKDIHYITYRDLPDNEGAVYHRSIDFYIYT